MIDAGVKRIQQYQCRAGILALLDIAGRDAAHLRAQDLGFVLGPRINAAGRMESMRIGIECLTRWRHGNCLSDCSAAQSTEC